MDHIPLPRNSTRPPLRIPCLYNLEYAYDHLGWDSFPERKGFDLDPILLRQDPTKSFPDILSFIQTWFFFGVLAAIAHEFGVHADATDFITSNDKGERMITTKKLPSLIQEMLLKGVVREDTRPLRTVAAEYLQIVLGFIHQVHTLQIFDNMPELCWNNLNAEEEWQLQAILLSISCLGEALTEEYIPSVAVRDENRPWAKSVLLHRFFQESGWCPRQAALAEHKTSSLTVLYFLSAIDRRSWSSSHHTCTSKSCDTDRLESTPRLHVPKCDVHGCLDIIVDYQNNTSVSSVVDAGCIPLINYQCSAAGNYQTRIKSFSPTAGDELPYVAFSHVWSE